MSDDVKNTPLISERRETPSVAEELGLIHANQSIMANNMESLRRELSGRLDDHSERINAYVAESRAAQKLLVGNIHRESELRVKLAKESSERHDMLMSTLNQVLATQASSQMAYMDMSAALAALREKHSDDMEKGEGALSTHKRQEGLLTRSAIAGWSLSLLLLGLLWSFIGDKVKEIIAAIF